MQHRVSVEEHQARIRALLARVPRTAPETVPLAAALGRVTATEIRSPVDVPLFRNSQMDGFAVRASDLGMIPVTLPVVGQIAARPGDPPPLARGTAVQIMTGAVVPDGADAVVPVEDTVFESGVVTVNRPRTAGEYVRGQGSDLRAGALLVPAGKRLASRHLAALAAAGMPAVQVSGKIRVVVVSTGAELIEPGAEPAMGEVFDSNGVALETAARACGADVTHVLRSHNDDPEVLLRAVHGVAEDADLILSSGGISMGNFEVVRDVLESLDSWIGAVAMQPGGPQAAGVLRGVPIVAFPGNPVSAQVSFEIFVAPILREIADLAPARRYSLRITRELESVPGKRQFLRARRVEHDAVELVAGPGSHLVAALAASDVLIDIAPETTRVAQGDPVEVIEL